MSPIYKNGAVFLEGTRPLDEALHVSGPYKAECAPNAYSFDRTNTVNICWEKVLAKAGFTPPSTNAYQLRAYVEKAWELKSGDTLEQTTVDANVFDFDATWPAYVHKAETVENARATNSDLLTIFRSQFKDHRVVPIAQEVVEITKGCAFQIKRGRGTRWYQPIVETDIGEPHYPKKADFSPANWAETWTHITALVQVYFPGEMPTVAADAAALQTQTKEEAKQYFPAVDLIRADAATIRRQYQMLMNEKSLVTALDKKAEEVANQIPNVPFDVIPSLTAQFRELKNFSIELDGKRRQLADAASDLNYQLFLENTKIRFYDDSGNPTDAELEEGELYVKSSKTVSWVTYQTVTYSSSGLFGIGKRSGSYQVPIRHSKTFDYYEKAVVDHDPWVEILDFYKSKSFEVYQFRYTSGGLIAADGSNPKDILKRCEDDEWFRRRCVIALPHKEITLIGQTFIVGYYLFVRPVPDIIVSMFPTLSLREQLSYRFTWMGVALGDLAATIPLSPGEEREVTLATSQRYESSRTETASSLIDITHIDKSDFETVFEKEVRKENESTTSFGASASGSFAGIVSGSANFSSTKTTKEVARQLNRSVQRASQEVNRRSKDERTVTISEKVETTQQNTTTFKVKNINQGSTLNIAFYRLYNAYQSLLRVDNFNFMVRGGKSPIASLDIFDERVFDRDSFGDALAYIRDNFPFDLSGLNEAQWNEFEAEVRAQIVEAYKEYKEDSEGEDGHAAVASGSVSDVVTSGISTERLNNLAERFRSFGEMMLVSEQATSEENVDPRVAWAGLLREQRNEEDDIIGVSLWKERTNFAYDSGGLYADVYVGQRPATEPYAEAMRRLEEQKVTNENSLIAARARYVNARATRQVLALTDVFDPRKMRISDGDVLILDDDHPEVKVRLTPGILSSVGWALVIKDTPGLQGGSFLQSPSAVDGILVFLLPRRFVAGGIANWDHAWFKANVSAYNADLGITVYYVP